VQIRSGQMRALSAAKRRRYVIEMAHMLRRDFPEIFGPRRVADLEGFVDGALGEAEFYGITLEADLSFYLRLQGVLSPRFSDPRHSWAREIVERRDLTGTEKMDRIHDHIVFGQVGGG
jgi:hypothetical protein